jgi:hypothetical protein
MLANIIPKAQSSIAQDVSPGKLLAKTVSQFLVSGIISTAVLGSEV